MKQKSYLFSNKLNFIFSLFLLCCLAQNVTGQTTLYSNPIGITHGNSDGPTGPDILSVDVSTCTSVSFSLDFTFSDPWQGNGNMESADECPFGPPDCDGDPNFPINGSCNNCWDFLWVSFNIDGASVGGDLIGEAGTTDAEQNGSISQTNVCTNNASTADISIVTQTWAASESVTISNIMIVCYEALPTITTNAPFCTGTTLTLDGSASDPPAIVSWMWSNDGGGNIVNSSAQNTTSNNPTNGETYTLVTTDPAGCTGEATESVGAVSSPDATISVNPSSGCAGDNVTFTFTGTPNAAVTYNDGSGDQIINLDINGDATVNATLAGTDLIYSLVNVALGSCSQTLNQTATVTSSPIPTASISVSPTTACEGDAVTFTFTGTPNATVNYFNGSINTSILIDGTGIATNSVVLGANDLTYILNNTTLGSCTDVLSGTATVTVSPPPFASFSANPNPACEGDLVTFVFTGTANSIVTYNDGNSDQFVNINGTGLATVTEIAGTSDITYILLNVALGNCTQTFNDVVNVPVTTPPTGNISVAPSTACPGDNVVFTFTGTSNAELTYNDGVSDQNIILDAFGNATTTVIVGASDLNYVLNNTMLNNCSQVLNEVATVTIITPPTASISVDQTTACQGDDVIFTIDGTANSTVTYNDGNNDQTVVLDALGIANIPVIMGPTDITYFLVDVTLGNCSQLVNQVATVTILPPPAATLSVDPTTACQGDDVIFTIDGTANATVTYNDGTGDQTVVLDALGIANIPVIMGPTDITYFLVDVTLGNCSQLVNQVATVTILPPPTATLSVDPTTACQGDDVIFTINGTANSTVTYNDGTGDQTVVLDASGVANIPVIMGPTDITYFLVDVTLGNCSQLVNQVATVTILPPPTATLSVDPTTACQGDDVIFTIDGTANATVTYNDGTGDQTVVLDASGVANIPVIMGPTDITYFLVDVTLGNCSQLVNQVATVTILPPPTATLSVDPTTACQGDDVIFTIDGTANATVTYNDGTGDQTVVLDASGVANIPVIMGPTDITYFLVDVTLGNCSQLVNQVATVTILPPPTATISVDPTTACPGETVLFTISGTANATVTYNDGIADQIIVLDGLGIANIPVIVGATNITCFLVNVNLGNCSDLVNDAATVNITPPPTASISVAPISACEGDDVVFTFTGTPNATVTYNDGNIDQVIALDGSGNANVNVTAVATDISFSLVDATLGNCSQLLNQSVTSNISATPTVDLSVNPTTACEGEDVVFTFTGDPFALISYTGGPFSAVQLDDSGNATITVNAGNTDITFTLVDVFANGCTAILNESITATITTIPDAVVSVFPNAVCEGDNSTFTFTGTPNASVNYNDGTGPQSIILDAAGTATVEVTTVNTDITFTLIDIALGTCGQPLNGDATLTIIPPPTATMSGSTDICANQMATITVDLVGVAPWSIVYIEPSGNNVPVNNIATSPFTFTTNVDGTYSLFSVSDADCDGNVFGEATIEVNDLLVLSAASTECLPDQTQYTVSFTATTGVAPYLVTGTGAPGSWIADVWTSDPIDIDTDYVIDVNDDDNCNVLNVSGNAAVCNCDATATMSGSADICANQMGDYYC